MLAEPANDPFQHFVLTPGEVEMIEIALAENTFVKRLGQDFQLSLMRFQHAPPFGGTQIGRGKTDPAPTEWGASADWNDDAFVKTEITGQFLGLDLLRAQPFQDFRRVPALWPCRGYRPVYRLVAVGVAARHIGLGELLLVAAPGQHFSGNGLARRRRHKAIKGMPGTIPVQGMGKSLHPWTHNRQACK